MATIDTAVQHNQDDHGEARCMMMAWLHGCMVAWLHGDAMAWMHGDAMAWLHDDTMP
jgi:hypothetical protein